MVPKRRLSLTLVRYIAREFTTILMLCIVVMLAFFLVAAIFDDLEDLLDARAPALDIVRYFALCLPSYLADAIPVSLLLTTTFVLARLCRHNEMAALRASGVSILTISLPIWIIAGLCAGLQFTVETSTAHQQPKQEIVANQSLVAETPPYIRGRLTRFDPEKNGRKRHRSRRRCDLRQPRVHDIDDAD